MSILPTNSNGPYIAAAVVALCLVSLSYLKTKNPKAFKQQTKKPSTDYKIYDIDYSMHAENRLRLVDRLLKHPELSSAAVLIKGGSELSMYDTDTFHHFRQESFFQYLFGVREPDCYGFIDLKTKTSILFVPRLSEEWELWSGPRKSIEFFMSHYVVGRVCYVDEMADVITKRNISTLLLLDGVNLDSGLKTALVPDVSGLENKIKIDKHFLYQELVECRVIKTEKELDLLRFINNLSSEAHMEVMKTVKPGMMEYHAESTFLNYCYAKGGARFHAYTCICGSGCNGSALHYGHAGAPNDKKIESGELFLNDMGAELHCYASDITCTFPVNGRFTNDQRMIYEGVLKAHDAVINAIKPGVEWKDLHLLSHRVLTAHLVEIGLLINGTVDELLKEEISCFFYPHGLGHLLGLDVHDVGGYKEGTGREKSKILKYLRCGRPLEANMVITVEPGCYFIDAQLDQCLNNPNTARFINKKMLQRFRGFGGVRIESDVIITATGAENMTKVPRTVAEIEQWMNAE